MTSFAVLCFAIAGIFRILRYSSVTGGPFRRIHFDEYHVNQAVQDMSVRTM